MHNNLLDFFLINVLTAMGQLGSKQGDSCIYHLFYLTNKIYHLLDGCWKLEVSFLLLFPKPPTNFGTKLSSSVKIK